MCKLMQGKFIHNFLLSHLINAVWILPYLRQYFSEYMGDSKVRETEVIHLHPVFQPLSFTVLWTYTHKHCVCTTTHLVQLLPCFTTTSCNQFLSFLEFPLGLPQKGILLISSIDRVSLGLFCWLMLIFVLLPCSGASFVFPAWIYLAVKTEMSREYC